MRGNTDALVELIERVDGLLDVAAANTTALTIIARLTLGSADRAELRERLDSGEANLPPRQREILSAIFSENVDVQQIRVVQ